MLGIHNWDIPLETKEIAEASLGKKNPYLIFRDEIGVIYEEDSFKEMFIRLGQPSISPALLAMITVMQFAEGLTDRQAAQAVGSRIDWKYCLGLEIRATGISHSALSEFRERLLKNGEEVKLLDEMLKKLDEKGWLKNKKKQRTDATHVLGAIRQLNSLESVGETLRAALNQLAQLEPEWLVAQVTEDWFKLYGARLESYRLPSEKTEQAKLKQRIGEDGVHLLKAVDSPTAPSYLKQLPQVLILRQVWRQRFYQDEQGVYCRTEKEHGLPPHRLLICSPYDPEARYRTKRKKGWVGYAVHLTETCEPQQPHLITHCDTTPATTYEGQRLEVIHQALADKGLLPQEHLVDTNYVDADNILNSKTDFGVELVGPVPPNTSWQSKDEQAYDLNSFKINWQTQTVTCPQGHTNVSWREGHPSKPPAINVSFSKTDCFPCPQRHLCTHSKTNPRRLMFLPELQFHILQQSRSRQQTSPFKELYQLRAGVEGAISQGVRAFDLRRTRYLGLAKTRLQGLAISAAINLSRVVSWTIDPVLATTRTSHFKSLQSSFQPSLHSPLLC
jgi:transposase